MGDPKLGVQGRGPAGGRTNRVVPDKGTLARQLAKAAADKKAAADALASQRALKKQEYLALALTASFAMQGRSAKQSVMAWGHGVADWMREQTGSKPAPGKPERVQSFLGGKFLRMYLNHEVDDDVVADAGREIGESVEFKALTTRLELHLQGRITSQKLASVPPDRIAEWADKHLDARKQSKEGIAFRNTLNTVIGGITGVDIESVEWLDEDPGAAGGERRCRIGIIVYDVYDFENKRSGEYDAYRKKLARLLIADKFDDFEMAFGAETGVVGKRRTRLDDAAVFASFMYALEKKRWTPGSLAWHVTVPAELKLHFAAQAAPAAAKPSAPRKGH